MQAGKSQFLPIPDAPLSLTSAIGVAVSGSVGGRTVYNIQNRSVVAFRNARIRTSNSFASDLGWIVDDLAGEIDQNNLRYSGGLFWAPGSDFTGQRRIIGAGVGTQLDTWADAELDPGHAARPFSSAAGAGRASGRWPAGELAILPGRQQRTGHLGTGQRLVPGPAPDPGAEWRRQGRTAVLRQNPGVAPVGHPVYFAYAGLLANTRAHRPIDPSHTLFYQAGTAWRLSNALALDLDVLGTDRKTIVEAGGWLIERPARIRVAALGSTSGDAGVLVQLASAAHGMLNFSFDLRRIWSGDGKPLLPLPADVETFDSDQPIGAQLASGSYTQAVGSVGLRLGSGNLSLVATYRKDRKLRSDYSIGPSFNWPVATSDGLQVMFELSGQRTRTTTAAFAGIRILRSSGAVSVASTLGDSFEDDRSDGDGASSRPTGSVALQYSHETGGGTLLTGEAGAERDIRASAIRAGGTLSSSVGTARGDVAHNLGGGSGTQYDLSFQSGLAISAHSAILGARETETSAIVVAVDGDATAAVFKVLVDDVPRGKVRVGQRLSLFVPGYRSTSSVFFLSIPRRSTMTLPLARSHYIRATFSRWTGPPNLTSR